MPSQPHKSLELYEYQLNAVEDLLSFHPDFIDVLTPEEQVVFRFYFLPDWDRVDDYRVYHAHLLQENPSIVEKATALLRKFLAAHRIDPRFLLGTERP